MLIAIVAFVCWMAFVAVVIWAAPTPHKDNKIFLMCDTTDSGPAPEEKFEYISQKRPEAAFRGDHTTGGANGL